MKKTSIRLAASILIVSILFLAGSTAFGIENQTNNTGNMTTNETVEKASEETVEEVSGGIGETPEETEVSEGIEKTPEETVVQTPEKTATAEKTIAPTPVPTEAPGFESIFAIATILLVAYIFGIRRR